MRQHQKTSGYSFRLSIHYKKFTFYDCRIFIVYRFILVNYWANFIKSSNATLLFARRNKVVPAFKTSWAAEQVRRWCRWEIRDASSWNRGRRRRETGGRTIPMVVEARILRGMRSIALATEEPLIFGQGALSE